MPVKLNGSTSGYTQLSAPATAGNNTLTLPTGNGTLGQLLKTSDASGTLTWSSLTEDGSNKLTQGGYPAAFCRAWVNFDGTGSTSANQTIRASYNVSSVYKNAAGDYTVNFTNALADGNYAVTTSYNFAESIPAYNSSLQVQSTTYTSSAVRVRAWYGTAGASSDASICNVAIFR